MYLDEISNIITEGNEQGDLSGQFAMPTLKSLIYKKKHEYSEIQYQKDKTPKSNIKSANDGIILMPLVIYV